MGFKHAQLCLVSQFILVRLVSIVNIGSLFALVIPSLLVSLVSLFFLAILDILVSIGYRFYHFYPISPYSV